MRELFAGVDLGGTSIQVALADAVGEIQCQKQCDTLSHEGPDAVISRIAELTSSLARQADGTIVSLGMGVPGLVDVEHGVTKFLPNLPTQWRDVAVAKMLGDRLGCRARLLNDARCATLGELRFGHGQGEDLTLAFFTLGTGVGGGVAIDGRLRLGPLGAAGELGHQTVLRNGPQCGCGNRGCLETLASGPAISSVGIRLMRSGLAPRLYELVDGNADRVTTREMTIAAADGDDAVRNAILEAATYLGIGVANVVTILHPQLVVLGGGVAEIGDLLLDRVRDIVQQSVGMFPVDDVRIEKSLLGDQAGVMGAIALSQT